MIADNFKHMIKRLHGAYGHFDDADTQAAWWYYLKGADDADVEKAVDDYIIRNSRRPSPSDIIDGIAFHRNQRTRKAAQSQYPNVRTVSCPYCKDTGWVMTIYPTGVEEARACRECPRGREVHPWEFLTDEEKDTILTEEEKHGKHPPRVLMRASDEFREAYLYGKKEKAPGVEA